MGVGVCVKKVEEGVNRTRAAEERITLWMAQRREAGQGVHGGQDERRGEMRQHESWAHGCERLD